MIQSLNWGGQTRVHNDNPSSIYNSFKLRPLPSLKKKKITRERKFLVNIQFRINRQHFYTIHHLNKIATSL